MAFRGLNRIISDGNVELVLAECSTSLEYEFQLVCGSVAWLLFYSRFGKIAFSPKVIEVPPPGTRTSIYRILILSLTMINRLAARL